MSEKKRLALKNMVSVHLYDDFCSIESLEAVALTEDFLAETEAMRIYGKKEPMTLLVYDDIIALGLCDTEGRITVGMGAYSEHTLIEYIDIALSGNKSPIRVVPKNLCESDLEKRLSKRLSLYWLDYDRETRILSESEGKMCPVQEKLWELPVSSSLYALHDYGDKVEVFHASINNAAVLKGEDGLFYKGLRSEGRTLEYSEDSLDTVKARLNSSDFGAIVIEAPMAHCAHNMMANGSSCLCVLYETIYAAKSELNKESKKKILS